LQSMLEQTIAGRIARIVVVASGCTDDTASIVRSMAHREPRIVLIVENR